MRTLILSFLLFSLGFSFVHSQVKIGDNPQNIDPASLLELESDSRALVITRVGDAQMQGLFPLRGALVYNTDQGCVFYFNGASWENLCSDENTTNISLELQESELILTDSEGNSVSVELGSAIDQTFSSDPIVGFRETIIITQTGDNYNFEVGEITGDNIVDSSINGIDLQDNSITDDKLAPNSVGQEELQDNAVSDLEIDYSQVTLLDFNNDANFVAISAEAGNAIINNNGAFYDDTILQDGVTANAQGLANHIAADGDLDPDNELVTSVVLNGANELVLDQQGGPITVPLGALNNPGTDEQNLDTNNNPGNISIDNGNTITLNVNDADSNPNNEIQDADEVLIDPITGITGGNVQLALEELQTDVDALNAGGGNTDEQDLGIGAGGTPNQSVEVTITNGNNAIVDIRDADSNPNNEIQDADEVNIDPITGIVGGNVQLALEELQTDIDGLIAGGGADGVISNVGFDGVNLNFTGANGGFNGNVDISALGGGNDGVVSNVQLVGTNLNFTGANGGFNNTVSLAPLANTDEQGLSLAGNTLNISGGTGVDLTPILGGAADGNDFISAGVLNVESLELTGTGGAGATVDLSPFALDTDIFSLPDDSGATNGDVLITDGAGTYSWATVAGGGTDTNNFITGGTLNVESLELTGNGGGAGATVNLSDFALDTDVATAIATITIASTDTPNSISAGTDGGALYDDPDDDPNNEIELPTGGNNGQILSTDGAGNYTWVDDQATGTIVSSDTPNSISAGTDGGALYDDPDDDPNNEIELPAGGNNGQILSTDGAGNYTWTDDQDTVVIPVSTDTPNSISAGTDGGALYDDPDDDPNNEIELPTGGNNGQILSTDGAGNYTWVDDQASGTIVSTDGGNIVTTGGDGGAFLNNAAVDATFATDSDVSAGGGNNMAVADLTLNANRTHDLNNNNLIFSGSGNVGIGGITPQNKLDVDGQIRARNGFAATEGTVGNPGYGFFTNGDSDTGIYRIAEDQLGFTTGGTEAMRIDAGQNIGVGTTTPTSTLHSGGSFATAIDRINGAISLDNTHHTVIITGNSAITLPTAANFIGRMYIIKNTSSTVSISTYVNLSGGNSVSVGVGQTITLQSDGVAWQQIN